MTSETIKRNISAFFDRNTHCKLDEFARNGKEMYVLRHCWEDPSIGFKIEPDNTDLTSALNNLEFPKRLSAIYHIDTDKLEVIWTAHKLKNTMSEVLTRSFDFLHLEDNYKCQFAPASDRLLKLGEAFIPTNASDTNYRNMISFGRFDTTKNQEHHPTSFWINGLNAQDEEAIEVIRSLNFYMRYYDALTPLIVVHPLEDSEGGTEASFRYRSEEFPDTIRAEPIDPNIAIFWFSATQENGVMRFLLLFRIIEYLSGEYIDRTTKTEIEKVLSRPHRASAVNEAVRDILGAVNKGSVPDVQRLVKLVRTIIEPAKLWALIERNKSFFCKSTVFDGGFELRPLISENDKCDNFTANGVEQFARSINSLRNALSHGKDLATSGVVSPTARNARRLKPWSELMEYVAGEIVIYKDVH